MKKSHRKNQKIDKYRGMRWQTRPLRSKKKRLLKKRGLLGMPPSLVRYQDILPDTDCE